MRDPQRDSQDDPAYDLDKYPFAVSGFAPAMLGEDGQYYLLPGLPPLPDTPDTRLPQTWKRQAGEGECGLPEEELPPMQDMLRLSRGEKIMYRLIVACVLLLVFRNLPGVRDWPFWRNL